MRGEDLVCCVEDRRIWGLASAGSVRSAGAVFRVGFRILGLGFRVSEDTSLCVK